MPVREWAHLCDSAALDAARKPLIIGEFDRILARKFPVVWPLFCVISKWSDQPGEAFRYFTQIIGHEGSQIVRTPERQITLSNEPNPKGYIVEYFMCTRFPLPGQYSVELVIAE